MFLHGCVHYCNIHEITFISVNIYVVSIKINTVHIIKELDKIHKSLVLIDRFSCTPNKSMSITQEEKLHFRHWEISVNVTEFHISAHFYIILAYIKFQHFLDIS